MLPKSLSTTIDWLAKKFINFFTLSLKGILGSFTLFLLDLTSLVCLLGAI